GYQHTTAHYGTKLKDQREANYQSTRNSDINTGSQIPTAKGAVAGKNIPNKSAKATKVELTLAGAQIATASKTTVPKHTHSRLSSTSRRKKQQNKELNNLKKPASKHQPERNKNWHQTNRANQTK